MIRSVQSLYLNPKSNIVCERFPHKRSAEDLSEQKILLVLYCCCRNIFIIQRAIRVVFYAGSSDPAFFAARKNSCNEIDLPPSNT